MFMACNKRKEQLNKNNEKMMFSFLLLLLSCLVFLFKHSWHISDLGSLLFSCIIGFIMNILPFFKFSQASCIAFINFISFMPNTEFCQLFICTFPQTHPFFFLSIASFLISLSLTCSYQKEEIIRISFISSMNPQPAGCNIANGHYLYISGLF